MLHVPTTLMTSQPVERILPARHRQVEKMGVVWRGNSSEQSPLELQLVIPRIQW